MIDAHEVGIQLALQDGVSAGLRVIAQELGTLDRALAATAGRLEAPTAMAVTAVAQGAARAAAAESNRLPVIAGPAAAVAEPAAAGALVAARALAPELAVAAREEGLARPEMARVAVGTVATLVPAAPVAAMTAATAVPTGVMPGVEAPESAAPVAPPVAAMIAVPAVAAPVAAPMRAVAPVVLPVAPQAVGDRVPAVPGGAVMAGPAKWMATAIPVAPITPGVVETSQVAAPMAQAAPVMATPRAAPAAPTVPGAPVGAMGTIGTGARGISPTPAAPPPRVLAMPAVLQAPAAPIAGRPDGQATMPGRELLPDRPAAPPPEAQDGGKSGGDVMLDGRLVGHWLADRMGRDAARPPAGPTHFNPRQAAAWTPSGAL